MGATYYQGVEIVFSPAKTLPAADLRYIGRHILRQTGLLLSDDQIRALWCDSKRPVVLGEPGVVNVDACIRMVDVLCNRLLGHDWPLNGLDGAQPRNEFFHNFTASAITAGFKVAVSKAA